MIRGLDGSVEYRAHFRWALLLVLAVFLVLAGRLFHLQVLEGSRYANLAWMGHVTRDVVPAPRGAIVDREGRPLAVDMEVADLMVVPHYLKAPADYGAEHLAGKTAQFEATLKKVEAPTLPEVNADFAREFGIAFSLGFAELTEEEGRTRRFNTQVIVGKDGKIVGLF